jgi:glycosyltransferase involved in cell wall biosynthesis
MTSLPHGLRAFVLDAHSSDGTRAYALASGATVEERSWTNFVDARTYALSRIQTEWTLMIDADEALDDRLLEAIVAAAGDGDGYTVRRTTYFHGKPMRLWQKERLLRLVRTRRARVEAVPPTGGTAAVHERLVVDGPTSELRGELLHYSYPDYASYRDKFETYTSLEAAGQTQSVVRIVRELALALPRFFIYLFLRGAVLDGPTGWFIAWQSAMYSVVVALKALRQAQDRP